MTAHDLDFYIPEPYKKWLMVVVGDLESEKTLSFQFLPNVDGGRIIFGKRKTYTISGMEGRPIQAFCVYGLLEVFEGEENLNQRSYFLTPKAHEWYKYHKKSKLGKWFARRSTKDIGLIFSIVVAVISLTVSILTAMDLATKLQLIP